MPTFETRTRNAEQVWASPDGQRVIYKVTLDFQGETMEAKTYSKAIASPGFSGTVETYEKQGQRGAETFVKQPPKENSPDGFSGSSSTSGSRSSSGNDEAIARAVALKAAVELQAGKEDVTRANVIASAEYFLAWLQGKTEEPKQALDNIFGPTEKLEDPWQQ